MRLLQRASQCFIIVATSTAYLFHDTGLSLGESDVTTRLVLDELDLNLAPLATCIWRSVSWLFSVCLIRSICELTWLTVRVVVVVLDSLSLARRIS